MRQWDSTSSSDRFTDLLTHCPTVLLSYYAYFCRNGREERVMASSDVDRSMAEGAQTEDNEQVRSTLEQMIRLNYDGEGA